MLLSLGRQDIGRMAMGTRAVLYLRLRGIHSIVVTVLAVKRREVVAALWGGDVVRICRGFISHAKIVEAVTERDAAVIGRDQAKLRFEYFDCGRAA